MFFVATVFLPKASYFANDVLSSPTKATAAPQMAVFLQPKWSVNMLTTGEQRKIMPMARDPTQAAEKEKQKQKTQLAKKLLKN